MQPFKNNVVICMNSLSSIRCSCHIFICNGFQYYNYFNYPIKWAFHLYITFHFYGYIIHFIKNLFGKYYEITMVKAFRKMALKFKKCIITVMYTIISEEYS